MPRDGRRVGRRSLQAVLQHGGHARGDRRFTARAAALHERSQELPGCKNRLAADTLDRRGCGRGQNERRLEACVYDLSNSSDGCGEARHCYWGEARHCYRGEARHCYRGEAGITIGAKQEKLDNAKGMLHEGLSADLISRVTGLSIAEINKLKAEPNAN